MPEFKDISTFNQVTPTGTERIQVSAANCVTLMDIANLGNKTSWYSDLDEQIKQANTNSTQAYLIARDSFELSNEANTNSTQALNQVSNINQQVVSLNQNAELKKTYNLPYSSSVSVVNNQYYLLLNNTTERITISSLSSLNRTKVYESTIVDLRFSEHHDESYTLLDFTVETLPISIDKAIIVGNLDSILSELRSKDGLGVNYKITWLFGYNSTNNKYTLYVMIDATIITIVSCNYNRSKGIWDYSI